MEKSKSQIAKEFMEQNPDATAEEIAQATGFPLLSARSWLSGHRRRLNPEKYKPRKKRKKKIMAKNPNKAAEEMMRLHDIIEQQSNKIHAQEIQITNLHHQITGYEAVISFLDHKLGER